MTVIIIYFFFGSSVVFFIFFFKQKTAYEMRISDWSSDVCSSDLPRRTRSLWRRPDRQAGDRRAEQDRHARRRADRRTVGLDRGRKRPPGDGALGRERRGRARGAGPAARGARPSRTRRGRPPPSRRPAAGLGRRRHPRELQREQNRTSITPNS